MRIPTFCVAAAACFFVGMSGTAVAKSANPGGASFTTPTPKPATPKGKSPKSGHHKSKPAATPAPTTTTAPTATSASSTAELETTTGGSQAGAGGVPAQTQTVPGNVAKLVGGGMAAAPLNAPPAVQQVIWAANQIVGLPYLWGGGHASWSSPGGYDCSGTVSFALHGGNLLSSPMVSGDLAGWGAAGPGQWITIYANGTHTFMVVAGLRLDTSAVNDPGGADGPRWRVLMRSGSGFSVRHPIGY